MSDTNRVRVSLTGRVGQMVHWFLANDPAYVGLSAQDVVAMLLERGVDAVYLEGMANAEPLDPKLEGKLTKLSVDGLRKAAAEARGGH